MVDPERLRRLLQSVNQRVEQLRPFAEEDAHELAADEVRLGYIKYTLQTALEGCIDAAHHVCSSEGWGPPKDNADAMKVLARNHVLDSELADAMADAVRFRNVLVHLYDKVDDEQALANLGRLHILDAFVAALTELLE